MSSSMTQRPANTEYASYYAGYIARVPDGAIADILERQIAETLEFVRALPERAGTLRYAPGKWSVKEVLGHLADSERIMSYRALRFARGDATPLAGFDENAYVPPAHFDARSLADLADELAHIRVATVDLFRHLDEEAMERRGVANNVSVTVRAIGYIIAGHERHHLEILRTRYLGT